MLVLLSVVPILSTAAITFTTADCFRNKVGSEVDQIAFETFSRFSKFATLKGFTIQTTI